MFKSIIRNVQILAQGYKKIKHTATYSQFCNVKDPFGSSTSSRPLKS
jgi:hypothetical protein